MDGSISEYFQNFGYATLEILLFGVIFFFIEKVNPAEHDTRFFKDDFKNELALAIVNILIFLPIIALVSWAFITTTLKPLFPEHFLNDHINALPIALQVILGALILDFSTYWRHRFTHFHMWSYHSVHHSAQQMTWLTGLRLHPIDLLAASFFDSIILFCMGFDGAGFLGAIIIVKIMNYFTHVNLNLKFDKPLRYILASPVYHRWHHATVKSAYDKNFCGVFPFWDILFGTYYHPEELPPAYGLSAVEQKDFPKFNTVGWLIYPFKREFKRLKKRRENKKKV